MLCKYKMAFFTNSVCTEPFLGARPCVNLRRSWKLLEEPRSGGEGMGPGKISVLRVPQGELRRGWSLFAGGREWLMKEVVLD